MFGGRERSMSPQNPSYQVSDVTTQSDISLPGAMLTSYLSWEGQASTDSNEAFIWQQPENMNIEGHLEFNFDASKPPVPPCANLEVMIDMGDSRIYSAFDAESSRL